MGPDINMSVDGCNGVKGPSSPFIFTDISCVAHFIRTDRLLQNTPTLGRFVPSPNGSIHMLNNIGLPGILLIAIVVLVLFGRGKISSLMGEVGKGITSFKKGINDGQKEMEDDLAEDAKDVTPLETEKDKV